MQTRSAFRFVVRRMQMRLFSLLLTPVVLVSLTGISRATKDPT
jgi:hypothetical protein